MQKKEKRNLSKVKKKNLTLKICPSTFCTNSHIPLIVICILILMRKSTAANQLCCRLAL